MHASIVHDDKNTTVNNHTNAIHDAIIWDLLGN